jgi:hypothetical protein
MVNLYLKINFGISIILKYYYVFEHMLNNNIFDNIHVWIDNNVLLESVFGKITELWLKQ